MGRGEILAGEGLMFQFLGILALIGAAIYPKKAVDAVQQVGTIGVKVGTEVFGPFIQTVKTVFTGELYGPFQPVDAKTQDILARTVWGEARGEGDYGMKAVACVVMNRYRYTVREGGKYWWGNSVIDICKKPYQFSCWLPNDPNYQKMLKVTTADSNFKDAMTIAYDALRGALTDVTNGADYYYARGTKAPSWSKGETEVAEIGNHIFYQIDSAVA